MTRFDFNAGGPKYPALPIAAKFRRKGVISREYGEAVLEGIRALQRSEGAKALEPERRSPCASGTWHADGKKILAAIRAKQSTELSAPMRPLYAYDVDASSFKYEQRQRQAYDAAIAEKRKAAQQAAARLEPAPQAAPALVDIFA